MNHDEPQNTTFQDESDLRKYRTELPNLVDDIGLSIYAYRLYGHFKRVCGANGGKCTQGTKKLAEHCKISYGKITEAKRELAAAKLIRIRRSDMKSGDPDIVTILDVWRENFERYAPPTPDVGDPLQTPTPDVGPPTPHETKKELKKETTINSSKEGDTEVEESLATLRQIPDFPDDDKKTRQHLARLKSECPNVDPLATARAYRDWALDHDKPIKKYRASYGNRYRNFPEERPSANGSSVDADLIAMNSSIRGLVID